PSSLHCLFDCSRAAPALPSFPTRRSSDLTLGVLHWDAALALLDEGNTNNKDDDADNDHRKDKATVILQNLHTIGWKARSNTGEDQKRHTVADTLFGDQLAHPHHQHSTRSHDNDHDNERKQVAVWIQHFYPLAEKLLTIRQSHDACGLQKCQCQSQITRVLRHLGLAGLTFLFQLLEVRNNNREELNY